ncbi:MAG: sodium:solute symporter family transporter [Cytophagaceae bacterium]
MPHGFTIFDFIILGIFFLAVLYIGYKYSNDKKGIAEHFLAGKKISWLLIGPSLFITTVSSEHVIGFPDSGYIQGFTAGNFAWGACLTTLLLAWFFVPFYFKNNLFTTPEYIERRFSRRARWIISGLSIIVYIITKVSVTLFAGALFLEALLGWDKYTSSLILVVITGIITLAGGFKGEIHSHFFHCFILIFCSTIVLITGIYEIGGLSELKNVPESYFQVFKSKDHPVYPWTGMLLGAPILQIWYWCTDQYMLQRVLSGKDITNARRGAIFAGYLMLLPSFILLVPGLLAYVKFGPGVVDGKTYFSLVTQLLPTGVKALAVAAVLSALISSLAASFNSASTLYSLDIYTKLYPKADEFKIVNIGKISTIVLVNLAIVWVSFIGYFSEDIIRNLQTVQSYVAPPYTAIFLVGMLWSRANNKAAMSVLLVGGIFFLCRITLDMYKDSFEQGGIMDTILELNFLYQAFFLFGFYVLLMIVVSLLTEKPDESQILGLTYKYRNSGNVIQLQEDLNVKRKDINLSILLALILFSIWGFLMYLA